jgi:hypothetical protein
MSSFYNVTDSKIQSFLSNFVLQEFKILEDKINSYNNFITIMKQLGTVSRDREYYGTIKAQGSRLVDLPDLKAPGFTGPSL